MPRQRYGNGFTGGVSPETRRRKAALERMLAKDRVLMEARMLPTEGPVSPQDKQLVKQALDRLTNDASGKRVFSFADVSRAIDRSPSVVSQWYHDKYKGDDSETTRLINAWIERTCQRKRSQGPKDYVDTWVCETMAAHVRLVDRRGKMGVIVSPSGSGKDMVIDVLAAEMNGIVIYCNDKTTAKSLLVRIAIEIGLGEICRARTCDDLIIRIADTLRDRSTIIMINEAQQLDRSCASVLRSIYDEARGTVPIVLFGSRQVFERIKELDKASGGGQFWRRCLKLEVERRAAQTLDPDSGQIGRRLYSQEEIKRFLAMKKVRLARAESAQVFEMMLDIANLSENGSLGLLSDVIETSMDLYDSEAITRVHVLEALEICLGSESIDIVESLEEQEEQRRRVA